MQLGEPLFLFYLQLPTATCTQLPPPPSLGPSCHSWISHQGDVNTTRVAESNTGPQRNLDKPQHFPSLPCWQHLLGRLPGAICFFTENSPQTLHSPWRVQPILFPGMSQKCVLSERWLTLWKQAEWAGSFQKTSLIMTPSSTPLKPFIMICKPGQVSAQLQAFLDFLHQRAFVHTVSDAQKTLHSP